MANENMSRQARNQKKIIITIIILGIVTLLACLLGAAYINNWAEIRKISDLLQQKKKVSMLPDGKNAVLVLGAAGSGKTVFVQWVTGDNRNLISVETNKSSGEFQIENTVRRIGSSTTVTSSDVPESSVDENTGTIFYDCPSFDFNRYTSHNMAALRFIKQLAYTSTNVKIVFLISAHKVKGSVDSESFKKLLKNAHNLIANIEKYRNSIAMVVTQVVNAVVKKGESYVTIPDSTVIKDIVHSLEETKLYLLDELKNVKSTEESTTFIEQSIEFINILLTAENEIFTRIAIFRRPNEKGRLIEMRSLQSEKYSVQKMIADLRFTQTSKNDFVSDRSQTVATILIPAKCEDIARELDSLASNVLNHFKILMIIMEKKLTRKNNFNLSEVEENSKALSDVQSLIAKFTEITEDLSEYSKITDLIIQLFTNLSIHIPTTTSVELSKLIKYFDFLKYNCNRPSKFINISANRWTNAFQELLLETFERVSDLREKKSFYSFLDELFDNLSEYSVQRYRKYYNDVEDWSIEKAQWIRNDVKEYIKDIGCNAVILIYQLYKDYSKENFVFKHDFTLYNDKQKYILSKVNDIVPSKDNCFSSEKELNDALDFITTFLGGIKVSPKPDDAFFVYMLNDTANKIIKFYTNSNFSTTRSNVITKNEINIDRNNFKAFVVKTSSKFIDVKNIIPSDMQLASLNHVLSTTLKHELEVICTGDVITLKGTFVLFSEIIFFREKIENCEYKTINIFALNTVFIDEELGTFLERETFTINIIAPRWVVIGNTGNIRFQGTGIADEFVNSESLKIYTFKRKKTLFSLSAPSQISIEENFTNFISFLIENLNESNKRFFTKPFFEKLQNWEFGFNTLGLVNHLRMLSSHSQITNSEALIPFYDLLIRNIEKYAAQPKASENSKEFRKVLSFLYIATMTKILNLRRSTDSDLIIDISGFFDMVSQNIKSLGALQDERHLVTVVESLKNSFKKEIDQKIIEANSLMKKTVSPEFKKIRTRFKNEISQLVSETIALQNAAKKDKTALVAKKEELESSMWNSFFGSIFNFFAKICSFLGPIGEVVGLVIGIGTTVVSSLTQGEAQPLPSFESGGLRSKLEGLGNSMLDLSVSLRVNENDISEVTRGIKNLEKKIEELENFKKKIYFKLLPMIKKMGDDLIKTANDLQSKSSVSLDIIGWQVQSTIKDTSVEIRQFTQGFEVHESVARSVEKLEEVMTILIKVYDRIQDFQEQQRLANYMADLSLASVKQIVISDPLLKNSFYDLQISIRSNILQNQYNSVLNAFKQWIFPFADVFFKDFQLPEHLVSKNTDIETLASTAASRIEDIRVRMRKYKTTIEDFDKHIYVAQFNGSSAIMKPFYVWKNREHRATIGKLLAGESVLLNADITNSATGKDAIKFNFVEFGLKSDDPAIQEEVDKKMLNYVVNMTHLGNSHYRYCGEYFSISSSSQSMQYSVEKGTIQNNVYKKLLSGDIMLSPYAFWELRFSLNPSKPMKSAVSLESFADKVDLVMEGSGSFVNTQDTKFDVASYYKVDDSVKFLLN